MKIDTICPCCNKKVQIILSEKGNDQTICVLLNKEKSSISTENNQDVLEQEMFEKYSILLG